VVAADKGTATFSDIANGISAEYGFWLGDAFASGGSVGYDHKKMGITARGAWEAVKRHFREMGRTSRTSRSPWSASATCRATCSATACCCREQIRLVAAFDHATSSSTPNPDPARSGPSAALFALPRSSWDDYDKIADLQRRRRLAAQRQVDPAVAEAAPCWVSRRAPGAGELINAILKAPVDLLYNGGIGTYVKASSESHADVGDRANDAGARQWRRAALQGDRRGRQPRLTQRGRIEFALNGGRINTDAIDNSAGVDCSDHEVNIKILLGGVVAEGELT
jgi:glutamate dehydrogenase